MDGERGRERKGTEGEGKGVEGRGEEGRAGQGRGRREGKGGDELCAVINFP